MPDFKLKDKTDKPKDMATIARETGGWHQAQKESAAELSTSRKEFFEAASKQYVESQLAIKTFLIEEAGLTLEKAKDRARKYNPGWQIVSGRVDGKVGWRIFLREDPDFLGHTEVTDPTDDEPGYVVTRTIRAGTTMIDLDRMAVEQTELYGSVTVLPDWAYNARAYMEDFEDWKSWIADSKIQRQPKPSDQLTPNQVEAIKPYIYEGPKTAALNVRLAKPEDYDE